MPPTLVELPRAPKPGVGDCDVGVSVVVPGAPATCVAPEDDPEPRLEAAVIATGSSLASVFEDGDEGGSVTRELSGCLVAGASAGALVLRAFGFGEGVEVVGSTFLV